MADKRVDLAGPGIGDYEKLEKTLDPTTTARYSPQRKPRKAITSVKTYIEENPVQGAQI